MTFLLAVYIIPHLRFVILHNINEHINELARPSRISWTSDLKLLQEHHIKPVGRWMQELLFFISETVLITVLPLRSDDGSSRAYVRWLVGSAATTAPCRGSRSTRRTARLEVGFATISLILLSTIGLYRM